MECSGRYRQANSSERRTSGSNADMVIDISIVFVGLGLAFGDCRRRSDGAAVNLVGGGGGRRGSSL